MSMGTSVVDATSAQIAACQALVYSLLQRFDTRQIGKGYALALVSAHPGAGVSHIQSLIAQMLNENEANCAIALDCSTLGIPQDNWQPIASVHESHGIGRNARHDIVARTTVARYRDRVGHLHALREMYRYVLLDCHSLKEMTDVLGLAPLVDGVIVVVECNKTTKGQLDHLERSIENYGGTILGTVLNKATYAIPRWINTWMERSGI